MPDELIEPVTSEHLRHIAEEQKISCKDTHRLYWGLYGYCLKVSIPEDWVEERVDATALFWKNTKIMAWKDCKPSIRQIQKKFKDRVNEAIDDFIWMNEDTLDGVEYYTQVTRERASFYFKTADTVHELLRNNPNFFEQMWMPATVEVENRLGDYADTHMLVRDKLWFNEYDYKIEFKGSYSYDDLDERVENLFLSQSFYSVAPYSRHLYLYGEDEYFLAKLALFDKIKRVTCCVLNDEATTPPVMKCV